MRENPPHFFQRFVADHASFFVDKFNYAPDGLAGARCSIFALFRDYMLPASLRMEQHVRSDAAWGLSTNQMRLMKRVRRNNGQDSHASARSIEGWEWRAF